MAIKSYSNQIKMKSYKIRLLSWSLPLFGLTIFNSIQTICGMDEITNTPYHRANQQQEIQKISLNAIDKLIKKWDGELKKGVFTDSFPNYSYDALLHISKLSLFIRQRQYADIWRGAFKHDGIEICDKSVKFDSIIVHESLPATDKDGNDTLNCEMLDELFCQNPLEATKIIFDKLKKYYQKVYFITLSTIKTAKSLDSNHEDTNKYPPLSKELYTAPTNRDMLISNYVYFIHQYLKEKLEFNLSIKNILQKINFPSHLLRSNILDKKIKLVEIAPQQILLTNKINKRTIFYLNELKNTQIGEEEAITALKIILEPNEKKYKEASEIMEDSLGLEGVSEELLYNASLVIQAKYAQYHSSNKQLKHKSPVTPSEKLQKAPAQNIIPVKSEAQAKNRQRLEQKLKKKQDQEQKQKTNTKVTPDSTPEDLDALVAMIEDTSETKKSLTKSKQNMSGKKKRKNKSKQSAPQIIKTEEKSHNHKDVQDNDIPLMYIDGKRAAFGTQKHDLTPPKKAIQIAKKLSANPQKEQKAPTITKAQPPQHQKINLIPSAENVTQNLTSLSAEPNIVTSDKSKEINLSSPIIGPAIQQAHQRPFYVHIPVPIAVPVPVIADQQIANNNQELLSDLFFMGNRLNELEKEIRELKLENKELQKETK